MPVLALLVMLSVPALGVRAQSKTGTTVGQFIMIEPGARVAAMGNAGVTMFEDVTSAYYNPGILGHLAETQVQFSHSAWLADIQYNYAAAAVKWGAANTLLLTITSLNSGEIDVRTVDQPLGTGERYTVNDLAFGVGFSRRITDRFSAGMQANYIQETIWNSSLSAVGFNFGVLYELPFRAYLGASISNFGSRGSYDGRDLRVRWDRDYRKYGDNSSLPAALTTEDYPLPVLFRVGLGFPVSLGTNNSLMIVANAIQPSDNTSAVSLGGEWKFMDVIALRAGYQNLFQQDLEGGLTYGAGLNYKVQGFGVRFDYSRADFGRLDYVQRFTLGVAL